MTEMAEDFTPEQVEKMQAIYSDLDRIWIKVRKAIIKGEYSVVVDCRYTSAEISELTDLISSLGYDIELDAGDPRHSDHESYIKISWE